MYVVCLQKDDKYRMAGIYTDYLVGFDFKLVNADKRFLINVSKPIYLSVLYVDFPKLKSYPFVRARY